MLKLSGAEEVDLRANVLLRLLAACREPCFENKTKTCDQGCGFQGRSQVRKVVVEQKMEEGKVWL